MAEFVLAFIGILLLIALMAVGVLFGERPIAGSCGGLSALAAGQVCSVCGAKHPRLKKGIKPAVK